MNDDQWAPCPPGELVKSAKRIQDTKRKVRRNVLLSGGVAILAVAIFASPFSPFSSQDSTDSGNNYAGITCAEVRAKVGDYKADKLEPAIRTQMEEHCRQCVFCRQLLARQSRAAQDRLAGNAASWKRPTAET